ncbi:4Fe-4S binding protein [Bacteroidota bacterium]
MSKIIINESYCPQNHNCPVIRKCPVGAIIQNSPFEAPRIDEEKCTECGKCIKSCNVFNAG